MDFVTPPRTTKLHHSDGWTIPPLDGSLSVPDLYDFHYKHNREHPVFVHAATEGADVTRLRFSEVVPAAHRAGWFVSNVVRFDHTLDPGARRIVAVLAASDTVTFFTTFLGMFRAGIPFMPVSPRNSPAAIAHLLRATRPTHLFVSGDAPMQDLAAEALALLADTDRIPIAFMPSYDDLYNSDAWDRLPARPRNLDATAIVVHSSGSTSFPKPIHWTDRTCGQSSMAPWYGDQNYNGVVFGLHGVAMYHGIGLNFMNWIATTGLVMAVFPPASPATTPSFDAVWNGIVATKSKVAFGPPIFIETWAQDDAKVDYMRETRMDIVFGGGPLNRAIGDRLASQCLNIFSLYGITEAGVLCKFFPASAGVDWEYITVNPSLEIVFEPQEDGTHEMIVISTSRTQVHVINAEYNGEKAYATSDLFLAHPTIPGRWKLLGRKDDQLVLSTGEKTNPTPLEQILSHDPYVAAGLVFGQGRFQNGLLVQLKPPYQFDSQDEEAIVKYRSLIWPTIEKMNEIAPSHSRLFREMILFTDPTKPFSFNAKGAPRRQIVLGEYDREIEKLHSTLEERIVEQHPTEWTYDATLEFVRRVVNANMHHPAKDEDDIFECGCDSLQAAWIRNTIVHALRANQLEKARAISTNFVYEYPRIASLAKFLAAGSLYGPLDIRQSALAIEAMLDSVAEPGSFARVVAAKHTTFYETITSPLQSLSDRIFLSGGDVVLVTGTTGGLGVGLLAKLVAAESVRKVYAFNRPSKAATSLLERQMDALKGKGYDAAIALSPKVTLIEADITENGLGAAPSLEDEIRRSVTHIIHNAWKVDFNLSLQSYEKILKGMRTLVNLALSSPQRKTPRVLFTSSVGVLANVSGDKPVPEQPANDPTSAAGQGYSESKWIGEQMLYRAAKETSLRPVVIRVGQISGGLNGDWKSSDWVPAVIKSSVALGRLPEFNGPCTWIPLDAVAETITDLRNMHEATHTAHIIHPQPQPSKTIFQTIGDHLGLPVVPYTDWLKELEVASSSDIRVDELPALKLLTTLKAGLETMKDDYEAIGIPTMECEAAKKASARFRTLKPLSPSDVASWLDSWASSGFLLKRIHEARAEV